MFPALSAQKLQYKGLPTHYTGLCPSLMLSFSDSNNLYQICWQ